MAKIRKRVKLNKRKIGGSGFPVKRLLLIFTVLILLLLPVLCAFSYVKTRNTISVSMSLNYEIAGKGMAPNKTRYNVYEIVSETVLDSVIVKAALSDVTANDISKCVSISPRGNYSTGTVSSEYLISLRLSDKIASKIDSESLLRLICTSYSEMFFEKYTDKTDVLSFDFEGLKDYDYLEKGSLIEMKANIVDTFLDQRINENNTYRSPTTGMTFRDIQKLVNNLKTVDLVKYNAYVVQSKTALDIERLTAKIDYQNYMYDIDYRTFLVDYRVRVEQINAYDALQSASVMIPTVDTDDEFYMSKTKTGIDYLADEAQSASVNATAVSYKINDLEDLSVKLAGTTQYAADKYKNNVNALIESLESDIKRIVSLTIDTNEDYTKYVKKDDVTFKYSRLNAKARFDIADNLIKCAVVYALLWLAAYVVYSRIGRKKANREAAR